MTLTEPELKLNIGVPLVARAMGAGKSDDFPYVMREGVALNNCKSRIKYPQDYPQASLSRDPQSGG